MRFLPLVAFCLFIIGCAEYSSVDHATSIAELELNDFELPHGDFSYYKRKTSHGINFLVYFRNNEFYEINKSKVAWKVDDIIIKPSSAMDLVKEFENYSDHLPFDYTQKYSFFRMNAKGSKMKVEGIINDDLEIYIVRFLSWNVWD